MAGTAVYSSHSHLSNGTSYLRHNTSLVGNNMEEDDVLSHLNDHSFSKRVEILDKLRSSIRKHGGRFPHSNTEAIFSGLALVLGDSNWDVRHKCIQLIHEAIPGFGDDLDRCLHIVLPRLIPNIGDSKITIRRAVIQTLHVYMKHTDDIEQLMRAIAQYGLDSKELRIRKEAIIALPVLFTPEFSQENFYDIAQSLAKRLLDSSSPEENLQQHALLSMEKIRDLVGDQIFNNYLQRLSAPLRRYYYKLTGRDEASVKQVSKNFSSFPDRSPAPKMSGYTEAFSRHEPQGTPTIPRYFNHTDSYQFGIVPSHIMDRLIDQSDFRSRAQAVEELKIIMKSLSDVNALMPHLLQFISFLTTLLDDANFKITTVTLEILGLLVEKLQLGVKVHLKAVASALSKRMGDNKIVVRQAIMKVVMQLMQILSPKPVLSVICENLSHRNSKVRQETLNIIIASLLTFPSYDFDLGSLCQTISHTLVDPKRQVRQAALECFAVLAQAMGAGKLQPLVQAVDAVELSYEGDGVMAAVQARLARRQLPRLNGDRLVDYATPLPSSATMRGGSGVPHGADIEWILAAAGGSGSSARSTRSTMSDAMELESVTSSARSTPASFIMDNGPTPRRFRSAGKGRTRLPWEDETSNAQNGYGSSTGTPLSSSRTDSSHAPMKQRSTWGSDEMTKALDKKIIRRNTMKTGAGSRDHSPDSGSYRQMYVNKYKRQTSDNAALQYGYNNNKESYENSHYPGYPLSSNNEDLHAGFSNSWPETKMLEDSTKSNRRVLNPISIAESTDYPPDFESDSEDDIEDTKYEDKSPIPTKPTLARAASAKRRVPPIPISMDKNVGRDYDILDSARDSAVDGLTYDDSPDDEMLNSLHRVRNSATKKKAEKIFENLKKKSPSPPVADDDESGIFSQGSSHHTHPNRIPSAKKKGKNADFPFESKPKLARKNSVSLPKNQGVDQTDSASEPKTHLVDYKPVGGVTFQKNRSSDVAIVGKGYAEDSQFADPKPSSLTSKARDRRRLSNKGLLSPLGMASMHLPGSLAIDDDRIPHGVIGKGVFEYGASPSDHPNSNGASMRERGNLRTDADQRKLRGVVGIGVKQNSLEKQSSEEKTESEEEDIASMSMSKTTRDRMAQKMQQKQEEAETRRISREKEKHRKQQEEEDKRRRKEDEMAKERERQQDKLRNLVTVDTTKDPDTNSKGSSTNQRRIPGRPPASTPKRKPMKPPMEDYKSPGSASSSSRPTGEPESAEDLKPFNDPQNAQNQALRNITNEDWEAKCDAISSLRRLAVHHPEVMCSNLHTVTLAVLQEIKNLRSQVSRLALICLGEMYMGLKRNMDTDLDVTTKVLLAKNGESNAFIRDAVDKALAAMVDSVTPQRALAALISGGASHRNGAVRKVTAHYLVTLVERMGPGRVLSGIKDVTDKVLPTASQFVLDGSPETRYNGQKILFMLMSHEDFDKMMTKHVSPNSLRNINDKLENLKKKGLGDPPSGTPSARAQRSGQGSRTNSATRGNSASSGYSGGPPSAPSSAKRRNHTDEATMEEIRGMMDKMGANDWRERHKGIGQLNDMTNSIPDAVGSQMIKIFDKFVPCLKDSNSKVNLYALQVLLEITPPLKTYLAGAISLTVQTVAANLSSKNREIHDCASAILDAFMEHLDGSVLLQPFANQATSGNGRVKPDMIDRVAFLVTEVYSRKQKQVILHVLPLLWHLLAATTGSGGASAAANLRTATANLVTSLYSNMGPALLEQASSNSNVTPKMKQLLEDLINSP